MPETVGFGYAPESHTKKYTYGLIILLIILIGIYALYQFILKPPNVSEKIEISQYISSCGQKLNESNRDYVICC